MYNLSKNHVLKAANYISNLNSIPKKRGLRVWAIPVDGINYPPKFLMSVALYLSGDNKEISNGNEFITNEAIDKFRGLGFRPVKVKK